MTLPEALTHVLESRTDAAGLKLLVVDDFDAAEVIGAFVNMEEGSGALRGPFTQLVEDEDSGERTELVTYEVQLLDREAESELEIEPLDLD